MTRIKPGRVTRIPDSVAVEWDGLVVLVRRDLAARLGIEPDTVTASQVWSEIVGVLVERYCGVDSTRTMTVDEKLDEVLARLPMIRMDGRYDPLTGEPVEPEAGE